MKKKLMIILMILCTFFIGFCDILAKEDPGFSTTYINDSACVENGGIVTSCGLPIGLTNMITDFYNLLKIFVPIVLIIMGMIDLLKSVASQKEDEIKKGWTTLARRTLYGVMVFFVFTTVQLVISLLPGNNTKILGCVKQFFTGSGSSHECIGVDNNKS